jgi:GT2 family glycosyltransferase
VNVGAPAARNWLLSLPEVQAMQWAAFLDDDVRIPPHWLTHLRAAAHASKADVTGCRITSADTPKTVQSADYHLLPPNDAVKTFVDYPEKIMVFDNCANGFDQGLFSYARPATSVSGCCHLLSMESVRRHGDFDIRFTPTQFDDLERDLRLGCAGMNIFYAGDLAIDHIQHSSLAKSQSLQSIGHIFGNKIKLEGKYDLDQISSLQKRVSKRLEADLACAEEELLAMFA